jgi:RHS repeat-associated protein
MPVTNKGFGELFADGKNALDGLQKDLAGIVPAFPGMPAGKYFDLAIGIDFEPTIAPPCPIFPVPHVGMVFDIMGAIMNAVASLLPPPPSPAEGEGPAPVSLSSVATAVVSAMKPSVKVHGQWINNAGTGIMHLPGIIIHLLPLAKPMASSEMWMGSSTVLADGGPFSTQFHPALSCNLVGFPSLFRTNKPPKPKLSLMLPTSMLLAILSGGPPVLVGGPPTIDLFQLMFKFGLKGLGKAWKKTGNKFDDVIANIRAKNPKLANILQAVKCKSFGEPVDAATGRVHHTNADFSLPGPLPLVWERTYYSDAAVDGPLGYNWHHSYNMGLHNMGNGFFTLRLSDGRETVLPELHLGEVFFSRKEQLFFERDERGYFLTDAAKQVYRFEGPRNSDGFEPLSSITNPQGFQVKFQYNPKGSLTGIIDSAGRHIKVASDALGRITALTTQANGKDIHLIQYHYDAAGNMVQTEDVAGAVKHFHYDEHLLVKLTNQSGMNFYWEYEGRGDEARCIHTWGDEGVLEYWTQYEEGHTITRNSLGHTTEYFYDEKKLIYKIIDAAGGITRQVYNHFEELQVVINPEGGNVQYQYNNWGKLIRLVNENEESSLYQYDERLNLTGATSPGGASLSWKWNEQNRLAQRTGASGNTVYYEYEGVHLKKIRNGKGQELTFWYDEQANPTRLLYPNGLEEQWAYDDLGNMLSHVDVRGAATRYQYNNAGQVTELTEPDGNVHRFEYDAAGNLVHALDATHDVHFEYGPLGILRRRKQANRSVHFNYDTELQLRSIVNEGGEVYKFGLDALGNVVSEWGFDGLNRRYLRDGTGRVKKVLRPAERWTTYDYDSTGNIVREEHSDGSTTAYKYNADGLLTEAFNEDSHIKLQRDKAGRITKEVQGSYEVTKKYDRDGACIHTGSNLGADIHNEFDEWGALKGIKADGWEAQLMRDKSGLELHRQLSGGVSVQTERDDLGRVVRRSIGAANIEQSRTRYQWGKGNKLHRMVNELTRAEANFQYDAFDNLISAAYAEKGKTETVYRMPDKIGNLFKTKDRSDRKYSKGGRLQQDDKYNYYYDAEGNTVFKEFRHSTVPASRPTEEVEKELGIQLTGSGVGWQYHWAGNGMLQKVTNPHGAAVEFTYDPLGRRIAKQFKGTVTRWVWDGNVPLHEWKYQGVFPPQTKVVGDEIVEEKEPVENVTTWVFEEGSFVPCAKIYGEEKYSIIADYMGTPNYAYNTDGKLAWQRTVDCYGAKTQETGLQNLVNYLFQGQYMDIETGLAYNRFRYYDNESGLYISKDPIGLAGGMRPYGYVNDPNTWIDQFGLSRLPRSDGYWDGEPGNSNWFSNKSEVKNITGGEGVPFKDGHADFSKWSQGNFEFDNLTGHDTDFDLVHGRLKEDFGLKSKAEAKRLMRRLGVTAHHHQDMKTIQLIPTDLHGNVPHEGGASKLRNRSH